VEIKAPEEAIFYSNLICSKCGEGLIESLGRVRVGRVVCIPCFEAKDK
jgi:formylmethanofuran dehydrogenase subunit E